MIKQQKTQPWSVEEKELPRKGMKLARRSLLIDDVALAVEWPSSPGRSGGSA
jgi:hypothetical protein